MSRAALLEEFERYSSNDIPIRLIYVPHMKLVGRDFVRAHFQSALDEVTDEQLARYRFEDIVWDKVKYAVLSHRWSCSEPSYQGFQSGKLSPGNAEQEHDSERHLTTGYVKLQEFCRKAQDNGIDFAWADTCCIDKTSSAELEESIRSMFRWYSNANLCIVHLAQTTSIEDMSDDEWFLRGWTLQELLAPERMKFYNAQWIPLTDYENDKNWTSPVLSKLSEATGIEQAHVRRFEPSPRKVDQRMTWAARRRTTRDEDAAYCLMGIFDVTMQIAYGEGRDAAFCRLVEAIMLSGGDPSILNWAGLPAKHHASRCLPASSASYVGHPSVDHDEYSLFGAFEANGGLDMTLTSKGLRVPLILVPVKISPRQQPRHLMSGIVQFTSEGFGPIERGFSGPMEITVHIVSADFHKRHPSAMSLFEFVIALTQYIHPAEDSDPMVLLPLTGFLLERRVYHVSRLGTVPTDETALPARAVSHSWSNWRRIPTEHIVFDIPDGHSSKNGYDNFLNVRKEHISTVML